MSAITTHVLDLSTGRPAAGLTVTLERRPLWAGPGLWLTGLIIVTIGSLLVWRRRKARVRIAP